MAQSAQIVRNQNCVIRVALLPQDQRITPFTITTSASAASGATSISVVALAGAIPSGTQIRFSNGIQATLSAAAVAGATSITVSALSGAVPSGSTATYPAMLSLLGGNNIDISFNSQTVDTSSYGDGLATDAAEVSASFSANISGIVLKDDSALNQVIIPAGSNGTDGGREVAYELTLGDGRKFSGAGLVLNMQLQSPMRDVLKFSFTLQGVGATTYTAAL